MRYHGMRLLTGHSSLWILPTTIIATIITIELTRHHTNVALLLLHSGSAGLTDNKERSRLTEILQEAVKCLQVERPDSHYGRVCNKAKAWLSRLASY